MKLSEFYVHMWNKQRKSLKIKRYSSLHNETNNTHRRPIRKGRKEF
jgi:hypothetical protein